MPAPEKFNRSTDRTAYKTVAVADSALRKAAKALVAQWHTSGFYDRQDPALALALHEALDA